MHAIAVELDLMRPCVAGRDLRHKLAQLRLDPGRGRRQLRNHGPGRYTNRTLHNMHNVLPSKRGLNLAHLIPFLYRVPAQEIYVTAVVK